MANRIILVMVALERVGVPIPDGMCFRYPPPIEGIESISERT